MSRGERAECARDSEIEIVVLHFARLQHDAYYFNERCSLASTYLIGQPAQQRRHDYIEPLPVKLPHFARIFLSFAKFFHVHRSYFFLLKKKLKKRSEIRITEQTFYLKTFTISPGIMIIVVHNIDVYQDKLLYLEKLLTSENNSRIIDFI